MPSDFLLIIDGIPGESKDSKRPKAIEIESYSWGSSNPGSSGSGGGGGAGKVAFADVNFTSKVSSASPALMQACATGQHIKKAQLIVRKQGDTQQEYYIVDFEDLLVSSYQTADSYPVPVDQFSLNFGSIK